jgi:hypothetical protein
MSESASGEADSGSVPKDKEFSCDACGKVYDSQRALSNHESKTHGGPVGGGGVDCPGCDRSYSSKEGLKTHLSGSNECDGGFDCDLCSKAFPTKRGRDHHMKEVHGEDVRPFIECHLCGEKRQVDPNYVEKSERHFCTDGCYKEWSRERMKGEKNPLWRGGGILYYGTNWKEARKKALERDNYRCQYCGIHDSDVDESLHVHHIKPLRNFEEDESPHELRNLVSLCRACHKKWEGIPVRPKLI